MCFVRALAFCLNFKFGGMLIYSSDLYESESEGCSVVSNSLQPRGLSSKELSRPEHWRGQPFPSPGDLPSLETKPRPSALQADSLPAEAPGKPKNTGVGSLSLLQWIFPTQELNWGLLHCRRILYQLSYQGSPPQASRIVFTSRKK